MSKHPGDLSRLADLLRGEASYLDAKAEAFLLDQTPIDLPIASRLKQKAGDLRDVAGILEDLAGANRRGLFVIAYQGSDARQ
jgi:hypothetical protein